MSKFLLRIVIIALTISFTNCSTNSPKKISISEFNNQIIKTVKIDRIVVESNNNEKNKKVFLYSSSQEKAFYIESVSQQTINFIVNSIKVDQQSSLSVSYNSRTSIVEQLKSYSYFLRYLFPYTVYLILLVLTLLNLLKSKFENPIDKLVWTIIIIFLPLIGILMYGFVGKTTKLKN